MNAEILFVLKPETGFFAQNSVKSNVLIILKLESKINQPSIGIVRAFFVIAAVLAMSLALSAVMKAHGPAM